MIDYSKKNRENCLARKNFWYEKSCIISTYFFFASCPGIDAMQPTASYYNRHLSRRTISAASKDVRYREKLTV